MDKGGGSSRTLMRRRTGGDRDVYLDKSSKKEKLRRLSSMGLLLGTEMDQLTHSINTNSTSNRVKVPKKFPDHCGAINHASAPRKLRSAMKKRDTKKHKAVRVSNRSEPQKTILGSGEEFKDSKMSSVMTKDEEEVAEALFDLAQAGLNTTPQVDVKPPPPPSSLVVEEIMPPNAPNRCSLHVYICSFIKLLQTNKTNPTLQQQVVPYFDHHHSQRSKQHSTSTGFYGNWQSQRHDRMAPVSGSNYTQGSMSLLASDKGKMQLSDRSSGYDEKGGLFFVDGPTLNLTL